MAGYRNPTFIIKNDSPEYDKLYAPGISAPHAGIYRCNKCGHEIGIAQGHVLPPRDTHNIRPQWAPSKWQLAVYAIHNK
jgi:hypothetical protein